MIDRLLATLRALAAAERERPARIPTLGADYADALRLAIDCPQIRLEPEQRAALERVEEAIERGEAPARIAELARRARVAIDDGST